MLATRDSGAVFDPALLGGQCWLELSTGERITLPVQRWRSVPERGDQVMIGRCAGPTLDVGCGPGRLTSALTARGVAALGVDVSPVAVRLTRSRGAAALRRDVFGPVPGTGRWRHVLLADGNIGIGGDPHRLLRRTRELVAPGGTVLVEVDPPGSGAQCGQVRINGVGRWFAWAWLGADGVGGVAAEAGLRLGWLAVCGGRWFAELERP
jgi:SAM-dependent methyltransferase